MFKLVKVFEVHKLYDEPIKQYPNLPKLFDSHCSIKMNNFIYYLGGETQKGDTQNVKIKAWR